MRTQPHRSGSDQGRMERIGRGNHLQAPLCVLRLRIPRVCERRPGQRCVGSEVLCRERGSDARMPGTMDVFAQMARYLRKQIQSFAKNAGLYGERIGALHVVSPDQDTANRVKSQLSVMQRSEISNPAMHGARLVGGLLWRGTRMTIFVQMALILNNAELFEDWKRDVKEMADRIISMREELHRSLTELKTPGKWGHITNQIGMFRCVARLACWCGC